MHFFLNVYVLIHQIQESCSRNIDVQAQEIRANTEDSGNNRYFQTSTVLIRNLARSDGIKYISHPARLKLRVAALV